MAVVRVAVAGATGKTGGPVARGIEAADDLELAARVAPSLAGSGEGAYGLLAGCPPFVFAACVGLSGWLASGSWQTYSHLRRAVAGLDWIVAGLAFFAVAAAISLLKTGVLAKRVERGDEMLGQAD